MLVLVLVLADLGREDSEEEVEVENVGVCLLFCGEEMDSAGMGFPRGGVFVWWPGFIEG